MKQRWKKRRKKFKNVILEETVEVKINDYLGVYTVTGKITHINEDKTMIIVTDQNGEEFDMLFNEVVYMKKLD